MEEHNTPQLPPLYVESAVQVDLVDGKSPNKDVVRDLADGVWQWFRTSDID